MNYEWICNHKTALSVVLAPISLVLTIVIGIGLLYLIAEIFKFLDSKKEYKPLTMKQIKKKQYWRDIRKKISDIAAISIAVLGASIFLWMILYQLYQWWVLHICTIVIR